MKIAVIGSGIAGMAAAHYLSDDHEVHLYESSLRLGGHTATLDVQDADGTPLAIDTGFIVFNDRTYPRFIALLDKLGIASRPTRMSFSVSDALTGLEYAGSSLDTLFAQRRNVVSPRFWRLVRDILRFNREVESDIESDPELAGGTLGHYLRVYRYSREFRDYYLVPMGAAIWSSNHEIIEGFQLAFFVHFFRNHGLLQLKDRPQWRTIEGGSRSYIEPLVAPYRDNVRLGTPVRQVRRNVWHEGKRQVCVTTRHHHEYYDQVVFACHSDQALLLLGDATPAETSVLRAIPYTRNEVVLHTDTALLPRNRRTWSSWNVSLGRGPANKPALTYNMNILQGLRSAQTWCVTLNQTEAIRDEHICAVCHYEHPLFTLDGIAAQQRWDEINGVLDTWFCGAWWRNGFHEDGVWSAQRVATTLRATARSRIHAALEAMT
ncbi:MAG: NAD(P)/FAD-dependent oxidoreductase [Gammaproteobacteria bacterium]